MSLVELLVSARVGTDIAVAVLLKGTVVLGVAAVAIRFVARSSASARHAVWSAAVISVGLLPAVEVLAPSWRPLAQPIAHYTAETAWVGIEAIEVPGPSAAEVGDGGGALGAEATTGATALDVASPAAEGIDTPVPVPTPTGLPAPRSCS